MGGADNVTTENTESKKEDAKSGQGLVFVLALILSCLLIIGAAVWLKWFHETPDGTPAVAWNDKAPRVIVINTNRIIAAATKKIIDDPNANAATEGVKLSAKLAEVMSEYRKGGAMILNGYAVVYCPPDMDKTAEVAEKVGVKLE